MKTLFRILTFLIFINIISCNKNNYKWENKDFENAIKSYCKYVDSVGFKHKFDFIIIQATIKNDSTFFLIYLTGGAYDFLIEPKKIADFISYNGHDILLKGDFPNAVVYCKRNKELNVIDDIVKIRFPREYDEYVKNNNPVAPLIYDYMNLTLIFKESKLINCKKEDY